MSLMHSPDMHKSLIARIPTQTGRELAEWFTHLEAGPAFFRREERANWLADEALAHGALVDPFPDYAVSATNFETAAWLLYPSRTYLPTKVRIVIDFLRKEFG